jgi:hypothetical protein
MEHNLLNFQRERDRERGIEGERERACLNAMGIRVLVACF